VVANDTDAIEFALKLLDVCQTGRFEIENDGMRAVLGGSMA
jgi:hypothetical protein